MKTFSFLLFFSLLLTSCANKYWLRKEAVPADVANARYTLLIVKLDDIESQYKYQRFVNEKLEKLLKDYPYPVALITKEELNSPKYSDVNKYRYVLRPTGVTASSTLTDVSRPAGGGSGLSQSSSTQYDYTEQYFTDRKQVKDYPSSNYRVVRFDQGVKVILKYIAEGK